MISRRLYDKIDFQAMVENAYTSSFLERAKVPIVADTDAQGIEIALRSCGAFTPGREKILRIRDTLRLEELYASATVLEELRPRSGIEIRETRAALLASSGSCPELW